MLYILVVAGALVCAFMAIRSNRLLNSALWLAGASALTALLLYLLGAAEVAVIELSVGAGLVTVLFVFAINIAGDEVLDVRSLLPRPLSILLIVVSVVLLGWLILPALNIEIPDFDPSGFMMTLWEDRSLDVLLQVVLIFSGVLGMIGLLAEGKVHPHADSEEKKS